MQPRPKGKPASPSTFLPCGKLGGDFICLLPRERRGLRAEQLILQRKPRQENKVALLLRNSDPNDVMLATVACRRAKVLLRAEAEINNAEDARVRRSP